MNSRFIVWNEESKFFHEDDLLFYEDGSVGIYNTWDDNDRIDAKNVFQGIGIKDINNKSIYADSSIVEFEHYTQTYIVTFHFDLSELKYFTKVLATSDKGVVIGYEREYSVINECDFKIIDTLQENKLGLIK